VNARARVATLAILCVVCARRAAADAVPPPPRVAVTPAAAADDPIVVEALNRLPFELADVGFAAPDPDHGQAADFVVGIAREGEQVFVSVMAIRPGAANALLRHVALTDVIGTDQAATIAIRAAEILRATILQTSAIVAPAAPPPPVAVRAPAAVAPRESLGWAVGVGTCVLQSFRGFGTGGGLSAHAALRPRPWLSLELAAATPLLQVDLRAPDGSATVHQQTLGAGIRYFFRASHRVRPSASLSGGVYHVSVDGHARVGAAVSSGLTAPFAAAAFGVMLARGESLALQLQAQAVFVDPAPFVIIGGVEAGHAGRPLMLVTLELEWRRGFRATKM
jgi:hypothetical protein